MYFCTVYARGLCSPEDLFRARPCLRRRMLFICVGATPCRAGSPILDDVRRLWPALVRSYLGGDASGAAKRPILWGALWRRSREWEPSPNVESGLGRRQPDLPCQSALLSCRYPACAVACLQKGGGGWTRELNGWAHLGMKDRIADRRPQPTASSSQQAAVAGWPHVRAGGRARRKYRNSGNSGNKMLGQGWQCSGPALSPRQCEPRSLGCSGCSPCPRVRWLQRSPSHTLPCSLRTGRPVG